MKLSSEIAGTKNVVFFYPLCKLIKKKPQKSLRQKRLKAPELKIKLFFPH